MKEPRSLPSGVRVLLGFGFEREVYREDFRPNNRLKLAHGECDEFRHAIPSEGLYGDVCEVFNGCLFGLFIAGP